VLEEQAAVEKAANEEKIITIEWNSYAFAGLCFKECWFFHI